MKGSPTKLLLLSAGEARPLQPPREEAWDIKDKTVRVVGCKGSSFEAIEGLF